jgi:uncharacterized protein (TIGR02284 family)
MWLAVSEESRSTVVTTLMRLIEVCEEGEAVYDDAASDAHAAWLKRLLARHAAQRGRFARALQRALRRLGCYTGTRRVAGAIRRGSLDRTSSRPIGSFSARLAQCARKDEVTVATYDAALGRVLPYRLKLLLERQRGAIRRTGLRVQRLTAPRGCESRPSAGSS